MSRSSKKGPYIDPKLLKKISRLSARGACLPVRQGSAFGGKPDDKAVIKTWSRDSEISPEMVGFVFGVHNGKDFITVKISEEMVGHRLGEFSLTRKFIRHGGRMQKELEKTAEGQAAPQTQAQPQSKSQSRSK